MSYQDLLTLAQALADLWARDPQWVVLTIEEHKPAVAAALAALIAAELDQVLGEGPNFRATLASRAALQAGVVAR